MLRSPWIPAAASVAPAALMLYGVAAPGGYYHPLIWSMWLWVLVGAWWLVTRWRRLNQWRDSRWELAPLAIVPVVFAASWWASSGDLVGRALFPHYRADLERLAQERLGHSASAGPFEFSNVGSWQGCTFFATSDNGHGLAAGFAWCPGAPPAGQRWVEGERFEPFDGEWYVYTVNNGGRSPWGLQFGGLHQRTET